MRIAQPGARVALDAAAEASATVAPGKHQVVVSLAGYVEARLEATAHEGKPVELDIALTQLAPIHVEPPAATLVLDDKPAAVKNGRIAIPPGSHVLVARVQGVREQRTVLIAAGGAAIVTGVVLCLTAPNERHPKAMRIVPTLGDDHSGLAVAGRF